MTILFEQEAFDALSAEIISLMDEVEAEQAQGFQSNKIGLLNLLVERINSCAVVSNGVEMPISALA